MEDIIKRAISKLIALVVQTQSYLSSLTDQDDKISEVTKASAETMRMQLSVMSLWGIEADISEDVLSAATEARQHGKTREWISQRAGEIYDKHESKRVKI